MKTKEEIQDRIYYLKTIMRNCNVLPMRKIEADNELRILHWVLDGK